MLIDFHGYCCLADFGLSEIINASNLEAMKITDDVASNGGIKNELMNTSNLTSASCRNQKEKKLSDINEPNFGTPEYLPPEFYRFDTYDFAGDWWALGCFLFELAAGVPPFFNVDSKRQISKIICKHSYITHSPIDTEPDYKLILQLKDGGP